MGGSYKVKIHVHFGFCSVVWEVVVVDSSRGVGLPRFFFAKVAVSGLSPVCLCQAEAVELRQPGPEAGLERNQQRCAGGAG